MSFLVGLGYGGGITPIFPNLGFVGVCFGGK